METPCNWKNLLVALCTTRSGDNLGVVGQSYQTVIRHLSGSHQPDARQSPNSHGIHLQSSDYYSDYYFGIVYAVWKYRLWSFQGTDTKLERF